MTDKSVPLESTAPSHSRPAVPDVDGCASGANRGARKAPSDRRGRRARRGGGPDRPFFVVVSGEIEVCGRPAAGDAHRHASGRAVLRRRQHDHRPPVDGAVHARQRAGEVIELDSRAAARAGADRRRAERDPHAGVHPPPRRADRARPRRRRRARLDALRRHAARQGVPDAQRPSVPLHRPRSRRRGAGAARSLSRQRGGRAGR